MAAVLALAACGDASPLGVQDGPAFAKAGGTPVALAVTQDYAVPLMGWGMGMMGAADFGGSLQTPTPCYDLTATSSVRNGRVTVTVTAAPNGNACIQVVTYNNYTGSVTGLAAGTYGMEVVNDFAGRRTTVHNGEVVVR